MNGMFRDIRFDEKGLVPVIVQDKGSAEVLTLCYMNIEALEKTVSTGRVHVFRRSKGRLMMKGETSGCTQDLRELYIDCEGKSMLMKVDQHRAGCHEGYFTCYFRRLDKDGKATVTSKRVFDPKDVYKK